MPSAASLSPKQARSIVEATARINLWHGAVRSGKTLASLLAFLHYVATAGPGELVIVGKTKDTIERNVFGPLGLILGREYGRAVQHTAGANTAVIFGRLIYIIGANDEKAESKLRGLTALGAYVDEATLLPESFWTQLLARLSLPGARLFATTNPDSPLHWLRKKFLDRQSELDMRSWHFGIDDNPALDPAFVAALKAEYVGLWYKRFILGLWVLAEGAVYDMFDPEPGGPHVVRDLPRDDQGRVNLHSWTLAIDYGTSNPFVAILLGVGTDGVERLYAAREWRWDSKERGRQLTDGQYSARLRRWVDETLPAELGVPVTLDRVFVDPSAASLKVQLRSDGWTGVRDADNEVADGIRMVSTLTAAGRYRIHESCSVGIGEKAGYVWDEKHAERTGEERPVKAADHFPDAERYGVVGNRRLWRHWQLTDAA